ncbi:hypothetical protein [Ascidiimonas aurantiaca]|uniref:hypothetical protein n=1 Tax=Ascidiimonas aurantiaca TaxID=1685432 RepID=UPI0030EB69B1
MTQAKPIDVIELVPARDQKFITLLEGLSLWQLYSYTDLEPTCEVTILNKYAWQIFTKGID